jgi:hypothetical protein
LFGGADINPNFALEGGYIGFANFTENYFDTFTDSLGTVDTYAQDDVDVSILYFAALGKLPISQSLDLFGKVGLAHWNVDYTYSEVNDFYTPAGYYDGSAYGSQFTSTSGVSPIFGVGISYYATSNVVVRAEFEKISNVGDKDILESDIGTFSVSAALRF